jgi:squamous cell carcinoma antigen recognized by T-cells 3
MSVLISNPERKRVRTDAGADDREVYVAGLSRGTTQADLNKLFKTVSFLYFVIMVRTKADEWPQYGTVKEVRLALDKDGKSKGFAFIEFEEEVSFSSRFTIIY